MVRPCGNKICLQKQKKKKRRKKEKKENIIESIQCVYRKPSFWWGLGMLVTKALGSLCVCACFPSFSVLVIIMGFQFRCGRLLLHFFLSRIFLEAWGFALLDLNGFMLAHKHSASTSANFWVLCFFPSSRENFKRSAGTYICSAFKLMHIFTRIKQHFMAAIPTSHWRVSTPRQRLKDCCFNNFFDFILLSTFLMSSERNLWYL